MSKSSIGGMAGVVPKGSARNIAGGPAKPGASEFVLGSICAVLLCGVLYAGLKPFRAPPNDVTWVTGSDALRFGEHGNVISSGSFSPPPGAAERSIEILVQPGKIEDGNVLLAFYSPASQRQLSICQSESNLEVRIESSAAWRRTKTERTYFDHAFLDGKSAFWGVTFGTSGTAVYRDGKLVKKSQLRPAASEISGRLILGNSPIFDHSWQGIVRGLAIYDTELNKTQIARHYESWTKDHAPLLMPEDAGVALYLFNELRGSVVHNRVQAANDLYIPTMYMVLRQTVLDPVWRAFNWSRGFWQDAFINVSGFMPFGCFFCAWFTIRGCRRPRLLAAVLGAVVSALIELTQAQLPTRDSSMSDLINNILGSVLGAAAYRGVIAQMIHRSVGWVVGLQEAFQSAERTTMAD